MGSSRAVLVSGDLSCGTEFCRAEGVDQRPSVRRRLTRSGLNIGFQAWVWTTTLLYLRREWSKRPLADGDGDPTQMPAEERQRLWPGIAVGLGVIPGAASINERVVRAGVRVDRRP